MINNPMNFIGLDAEKSKLIARKLQILLANYSYFYQNVRGLHWNIKGDKFFELHLKFEELYMDIHTKIDEIAERILTLGDGPQHAFSKYSEYSKIVENEIVENEKIAISTLLNSFQIILELQREILTLAQSTSDEGTSALMSDYIRNQEKMVWMYASYLGTSNS